MENLWGMAIDLDKCTLCGACVVACQSENNIPIIDEEQSAMGRGIFWMNFLADLKEEGGKVDITYYPMPCLHCDKPPCTKVCPVNATMRDSNGIVAQIYFRCIGCRYCTAGCPYTIKYFNWFKPEWPEELRDQLNPDVTVRDKGVVEKCTFCSHRLMKARDLAAFEGREVREGDYVPACMEACPSKAIHFGDLKNEASDVSVQHRDRRALKLMEELGTEPKCVFLTKGSTK